MRRTVMMGLFIITFCIGFILIDGRRASAETSQPAWVLPNAQMELANSDDFIDLKELIPDIEVELKYATTNNITGKRIYDFSQAFLRLGPALKLKNASAEAEQLGYRIKVWDAYRPPEAQFELWQALPNSNYIANPYTTFSIHSRGAALDVTLTDINGNELSMPSQFDDSTDAASRNYADDPSVQATHAQVLEKIMYDNGFTGLYTEWWHFQDDTVKYPAAILNIPSMITFEHNNTTSQVYVYIVDGRILAPVRFVADLFNLNVQWDSENNQVLLEGYGRMVAIEPDSNLVAVNGTQTVIPTIPHIIAGRTYVPLRILSELFARNIVWEGVTQRVIIN